MRYFNGRVKWNENFIYEETILDRFRLYKRITNYIDDNDICNISIDINQRIGSDSKNGEVYMGKIVYSNFAIKVLPIINDNSFEKNRNEIAIAELASQMVLENRTIHFPIVYGYDLCENTIFYNEKFTNKSKRYQNNETKSHILIMELGCCDLKQYLKNNNISKKEKDYIKKQCLQAIDDMHRLLGVCHNDLHLANFLLLPSENKTAVYGYIILIHDFGSADFRKEYCNLDYEFFEEQFKF